MTTHCFKSATSLLMFVSLYCANLQAAGFIDEHKHAHNHAEKGVAAATLFPGYAELCDLTMVFRDVNAPRVEREPRPKAEPKVNREPRSRESEPKVKPMKVFDNFYFVGNAGVSAWVLGTDEGYILIDALTSNEEAQKTIEQGMLSLGLDPNKIRYLLITHAHGDHYGGHRYLKEKYNMPIVMSELDWQLAATLDEHPRFGPAPKQDQVVHDGDVLKAGKTTLEIHVTPGHTIGTISPVFTVYDQGKAYRAALWGGTGFNFGVKPEQFAAYASSAVRFKQYAEQQNVSVFFSNHGKRDGSIEKMELLAKRVAGEAHPFVMGERAQDVYEVLAQCAMAQYDRIAEGQYPADK